MNFDIFPSVSAPGQLCTRELLEKAICNDALTPLYEAIAAAEGDKRQALKRRLPGVTWQAHFPDGRRRPGTGEWSSRYMVDVDHIDDPAAIWKALEPRTAELGIVVAHVTPSRKGLRLVCRCRKGLTSIAANQAWLAQQTGLDIDAATKDQARLSYLVPASYFFLLDEGIWEAKEGLENLEPQDHLAPPSRLAEAVGEELDLDGRGDALIEDIIDCIEDGHVDMITLVDYLHAIGAVISLGYHFHFQLSGLD